MSGCGFGLVDVVHQTLCFFLSFQTTLVQSVFCVHPHILLHSTSIPQHTATTTMPTVSPTTTQSLRSDTAIALFVCTPSTIPFCLLSLCIHTCLWSTLLHFKTHCVFTLASHNHIVWCLCACSFGKREKRQAMTTKQRGKEGLRFDGCWFCESPAHPLFSINPLFVFMPTPPHSTLTIPTMCFVPHSNHHQ